ncbi:hypothetical protein U8607_21235 [Methylobacterium durans]|uniref:hypothetical protein n=1 Tax=Methylobacterium durans TaxID=2202825 RepID=UPI002AFEE676|nr:hypothetical protein [Methylobacterium durans]MEA1834622.1 hypothetical protein [Methylobacterium durans]
MRAASLIPALGLLAGLTPMGLAARPGWISGTYVYADLCTRPASGDLSGRRITLRRSPNGDGLVYEVGQGTGLVPVQAAPTVDDAARTVAFTAQTETGPVSFEGSLSAEALTGTLSDASGARPLRLTRVLRAVAPRTCLDPAASETTGSLSPTR